MKLNGKWTKKKWVSYTIATCSAVVLFMVLSHLGDIFSGIGSFFQFIRPVVLGIVVAYVLNPFANFYKEKLFKKIKGEKKKWAVSVAFTIIVLIAAIVLLGVALVPQLADSVSTLFNNMDSYIDTLQDLLGDVESGSADDILDVDLATFTNLGDILLENLENYLTSNVDSVVDTSAYIGRSVFDGLLAFILAIYFLLDKKRIVEGMQKLYALNVKEETFEKTNRFLSRCNDIIIKYISFDILDGIIVGVANFVFMLIMGMPYSVLISVIVGVTNLAPTFGPIVGAVIGAFILVLVNPWHALWFLIFTIILQTVDGYVLKPRLFGESLGVSPLMILISIILGGRLFGVVGILFAIPFAAILDFILRDYVYKKLEDKRAKQYNI